MALTAAIVSLNPSIVARQNTGTDSENLQQIQRKLLSYVKRTHPEAMYPAAFCTLADLEEVPFKPLPLSYKASIAESIGRWSTLISTATLSFAWAHKAVGWEAWLCNSLKQLMQLRNIAQNKLLHCRSYFKMSWRSLQAMLIGNSSDKNCRIGHSVTMSWWKIITCQGIVSYKWSTSTEAH